MAVRVLTQILERLPATVILMGSSMLLGFLIAIVLGLYSGKYKNGLLDKIVSVLCYVGISIPTFWFGIMAIYLFSVHLGWLPSYGMYGTDTRSIGDLMLAFDHAMRCADLYQCGPVYPISAQQYHHRAVLGLRDGAEGLRHEAPPAFCSATC